MQPSLLPNPPLMTLPGGVRFVLSCSALLTQSLLLRLSQSHRFLTSSEDYSYHSSTSSSSAVVAAAEQLFVHGTNLSDLLVMYHRYSGELHRSMRVMYAGQRRSVCVIQLSDPLQLHISARVLLCCC
jgi:hypothetical protein